jgi:hypothetical protein
MNVRKTLCIIAALVMTAGLVYAQSTGGKKIQSKSVEDDAKVKGSGTPDHITRWVDDKEIGDSGIIETHGNVGIGANPHSTAKLFVSTNSSDQPVAATAIRGGNSGSGRGVEGSSVAGIGVNGVGEIGVNGLSLSTDVTRSAIQGVAFNGALAGKFVGNVEVTGKVGVGQAPSSLARFFVLDNSGQPASAISAVNNGTGRAVMGLSQNGIGVNGAGKVGLNGITTSSNANDAAVRGISQFGVALAGDFMGDVRVSGMLSKGGGSFKIDHPLDPENKYLSHSFVESPDMMNIYNGNITTDENGEAVIPLPEYFEALNKDFRYQLTVIGTFAQAIVADKVKDNRFKIKTNAAGVEVSWQVTGIRQDGWANKNRIQVEVQKNERERGFYLHPEAFNQSEERGVEWARNPAMMNQLREARGQNRQQYR